MRIVLGKKMKRIICLIAVFLLSASFASADRYLEASFTFPENRIETIDLYEQNNQITAVSTLIPEYALITDHSVFSGLSLFYSICSLNPGTTHESIQKTDKHLRDMIEQYLTDPVQGVYSGELFENAGSVRTVRFQLSDFFTSVINTLDSSDEPFAVICNAALSSVLLSLQQTESLQEPSLEIKIYDNWRYISAMLFNQEQVIMTVSSDLSTEDTKRILICYSENGRYYFRDVLIKEDNENFTLTASLRSGKESSYQPIMKEKPLTAVQLNVTNERFELEMHGNGLSEPLIANGATSVLSSSEAQLTAGIFINNHHEQAIKLRVNLFQMARPVNFSDKEMINLSDQTENAGFTITAFSKATELAAEMIPTLPVDYQKLLIKLLYP